MEKLGSPYPSKFKFTAVLRAEDSPPEAGASDICAHDRQSSRYSTTHTDSPVTVNKASLLLSFGVINISQLRSLTTPIV